MTISAHQKVGEAIGVMQRYSISQLPVVRDGEVDSLADVIGSLPDRDLLDRVFKNPDALHEDVANAMQPPLAAVDVEDSLDEVRHPARPDERRRRRTRQQAGRRADALRPARVPRAQPRELELGAALPLGFLHHRASAATAHRLGRSQDRPPPGTRSRRRADLGRS